MNGFERFGLVVAALLVGLATSYFLAQWWSPVCHEGCLPSIQLSMWLFLLALPIALAAVVAVAAGRPRAIVRIGLTLATLAVLGIVLTALAAWLQGRAQGR